MSKTYQGYLLIADITGYTRYLSASELEHAQETLTALLKLLVENTGPPLVISRLEGDAVISYGLEEDFFKGQTFIEKLEEIYVTFRKALQRLVLNNTCQCNACANISTLDLKFFVHHGTFGIQHISNYYELVGSDINLLHRLLKNHVVEATGIQAYALYTGAAIQQLGLEEIEDTMVPHHEAYEYLDEVKVWVQDLHPVWEAKRSKVRVTLPEDQIVGEYSIWLDMPREQAWEYMTHPEFRHILTGSDRIAMTDRKHGRIAPGSVYQCYHGDKIVPQTILEWQPFEQMVVHERSPMFPENGAINDYTLTTEDGGTCLTKRFTRLTGPVFGRIVLSMITPIFKRMMQQMLARFKQEIERDYQERRAETKPGTPVSAAQISDAASDSLRISADQE